MATSPQQPVSTGLEWAHPLVQDWFVARFGTPTEPQAQGWPHILAGKTTLISAPTGSGKTLAAFLTCIDRLVRKALSGDLTNRTEVLYVSPLKALSNDIQKNLETPLGEILLLAGERGLLMPEIRTAVRTGDTLAPKGQPVAVPLPDFPPPALSVAVKPASRADDDKLMSALQRLCDEDLSLTVTRDDETHQTILGVNGEVHLAELHWYEAHGVGRRKMKVKRRLD